MDGLTICVVNGFVVGSINVEVAGGIVVGSSGDLVVGVGVYEASIEIMVVLESLPRLERAATRGVVEL
ncbi:hypothetical protein V6N13_010101 [Hibiscus sabdariffa]